MAWFYTSGTLYFGGGPKSESWYNKTTGMVICSDTLIECDEELITCL